jgi:hypothetical protein
MRDQLNFGTFSGDMNPIHVDPVLARRTLHGVCIVHGMHALLWALDHWAANSNSLFTEFSVRFIRPMKLDCLTHCEINETSSKMIISQNDRLCVSINLKSGTFIRTDFLQINKFPARPEPIETFFDGFQVGDVFDLNLHGNVAQSDLTFKNLSIQYGELFINEIAELSQVVGMECPGTHSLFASLVLKMNTNKCKPTYRISKMDRRIKLIGITAFAQNFDAMIECFFRPKPVKNIDYQGAMEIVTPNEFHDVNALIIGGSRGLGECAAKLISAGGGNPVISYMQGADDATLVVDDICSSGGRCEKMHIDIDNFNSLDFTSKLPNFNQIYYFASPKIMKDTDITTKFEQNIYKDFYEKSFKRLVEKVSQSGKRVAFFYPSTSYIDDRPLEFANYVSAKIAGELLCTKLEATYKNLNILCRRLPALHTDQNQSLLENEGAVMCNSEIILPLIRQMSKIMNKSD